MIHPQVSVFHNSTRYLRYHQFSREIKKPFSFLAAAASIKFCAWTLAICAYDDKTALFHRREIGWNIPGSQSHVEVFPDVIRQAYLDTSVSLSGYQLILFPTKTNSQLDIIIPNTGMRRVAMWKAPVENLYFCLNQLCHSSEHWFIDKMKFYYLINYIYAMYN